MSSATVPVTKLVAPLGGGRRPFRDGLAVEQLRPILEMHRVVVGPFAAPDKAVPLEDLDDLARDPIAVSGIAMAEPVVPICRIDVDRGTPSMHARLPRIGYRATVVGAGGRIGVPLQGRGQRVHLHGDG